MLFPEWNVSKPEYRSCVKMKQTPGYVSTYAIWANFGASFTIPNDSSKGEMGFAIRCAETDLLNLVTAPFTEDLRALDTAVMNGLQFCATNDEAQRWLEVSRALVVLRNRMTEAPA